MGIIQKANLGIGTMTNVIEIRRKNDDGSVAMHWNTRLRTWRRIARDMWIRFWNGEAAIPCLTGDHYFVVCAFELDGRVANIRPHRYRLNEDGLITPHDFDDLSDDESKMFESLYKRYYESDPLKLGDARFSEAERTSFDRLRERVWRSWLPPTEAAVALLDALPYLPSSPDSAARDFFRKLGIETCSAGGGP
jgi:hypothetical protein